ncbi:MAG: tetratricopeptide repeat protein [Candidatus Hodarchaeota archaeon]
MQSLESSEIFTSIKQFICQRKFDKAQHAIENYESRNDLTSEERLTCQIFKGKLMNSMDKYENALKTGKAVLKASQESKLPLIEVDALLLLCHSLISLGELDEGLTTIQKCEKIITTQKSGSIAEIKLRKSNLFYYKGILLLYKGQLDQSLDYLQRSLRLSEEINEMKGIVQSLNAIGRVYSQKGRLSQALSTYQKSYRLSEKIGYKEELAKTLNNMGIIYRWEGKIDDALACYQQNLELFKDLKNERGIAISLNNLGLIYHWKGEIDSALRCYTESLRSFEETSDKINTAAVLNNLGSLYQQKSDFNLALECLKKSLELKQQLGNDLDISRTLYSLISIVLDQHSLKQARKYLHDLYQINDRNKNKIISQAYFLARGMVINTSNRLRDKIEAQKLFEKVSNDEVVEFTITTTAMLQLIHSLLFELKTLGNKEILNEIQKLIRKILNLSKNQSSHWLLAEAYLLQSQLALIDLETEKAEHLLTQAQKIADKKGLQGLAMRISKEHDILLEHKHIWEDLTKDQIPLVERVQMTHLGVLVEGIIQKKMGTIPELSSEEPVFLLILAEGGLIAYYKYFSPLIQLNKSLIGAFIGAIQMFSEELFSQSIDRIKLKEYTILVRSEEPFMICYVFKGQTYTAQQKLKQFTLKLRRTSLMWGSLLEFLETSIFVEDMAQSDLDNLVINTFQPHS